MSFFHILPSNVSLDTYPNNCASNFSTPITNPYVLKGRWETALMNITYSGCVDTFHNDKMIIEKTLKLSERLQKTNKAVELKFTLNTTTRELVQEINTKLSDIVTITLNKDETFATWKVLDSNVCIALSPDLKNRFDLFQDVFTPYDNSPSNYYHLKHYDSWNHTKYYIIVIPASCEKTSVALKSKNETISKATFLSRCNDERLKSILRFHIKEPHIIAEKHKYDDTVVVFSPGLYNMLGYRQAGLFGVGEARFLGHSFPNFFKSEWIVYIFHLNNNIEMETAKAAIPITLPPRSFKLESDVVPYLTKFVDDSSITFSLNKSNVLKLTISDKETSIKFSDTLRDIFAFDQNVYSGKGSFSASDSFSLTRRIQYLYVYSNISDYVRIGNTEAPLLAVIPFDTRACKNLLREKTFKSPMYVPVIQDCISQINIAIYDGAGELVPFATDAVTSLRLHFRQA